jgi:hypothetical protein
MLKQQVIQQTRHWLEAIVVGLNLCPFAAPVLKQGTLHIEACDAVDEETIFQAILQQLDYIQQNDEQVVATSLLVFSEALQDFDDYLDVLGVANELLSQSQLEGVIQIASFHPQYCFDAVAPDDISNYTNRSPYPMLHFIREAQMSRVLENYPNPEAIPENNMARLRDMGLQQLQALLKSQL